MNTSKILSFIRRQKVAFICSVDEAGFPNVKAMLRPREIEGLRQFYFSTNTSSLRVQHYLRNPNASIYFYHKGLIRYTGGVIDPDYCVLRFTAQGGRYYCDLKTEDFAIPQRT